MSQNRGVSNSKKPEERKFYDIKLEGERSGHVEKLVNELGTWGFFKYLYRKGMLKILLINILVLLLVLPSVFLIENFVNGVFGSLSTNYSDAAAVGLGNGSWMGFDAFYADFTAEKTAALTMWQMTFFVMAAVAFSGVFAVIRDAFWTGEVKIVKPFIKGLGESLPYMLPFMIILAVIYWGMSQLFMYAAGNAAMHIMLQIVCYIAYVFLAMYVMILYGVVAVHKQNFSQSMNDAWKLLRLNFIPNIFAFAFAFAPTIAIANYTSVLSSQYGMIILMVFIMIGLFYVPFVWMTHMMKTFRLFHPVEKKRIK